MTYEYFQREMAFRGFIYTEITETGFKELTGLGFSFTDCVSIEMDLQAGFDLEDATDALKRDA
jgi:hypothetical protein